MTSTEDTVPVGPEIEEHIKVLITHVRGTSEQGHAVIFDGRILTDDDTYGEHVLVRLDRVHCSGLLEELDWPPHTAEARIPRWAIIHKVGF